MRVALDHVGPQTTIGGFLLGPVQSGLMVLHRRETLERDAQPRVFTFTDQQGDLLNLFRPRGVLCVPLRLKSDRTPLLVANTHANAESATFGAILSPHSLPSVPLNSEHRCRQLRQLFGHARRLASSSRVIICGDLNSTPEDEEIPFGEFGFAPGTTERHNSWNGLRNPLVAQGWFSEGSDVCTQLDYIFTSSDSGLRPTRSRLVLDEGPPWLSDHFGVLSDFTVGEFTPRPDTEAVEGLSWGI